MATKKTTHNASECPTYEDLENAGSLASLAKTKALSSI